MGMKNGMVPDSDEAIRHCRRARSYIEENPRIDSTSLIKKFLSICKSAYGQFLTSETTDHCYLFIQCHEF
jgi:hypothetical protein